MTSSLCTYTPLGYFFRMSTENFGDVYVAMRAVLEEEYGQLFANTAGPSWNVQRGHVHVTLLFHPPHHSLFEKLRRVADKAVWDAERRLRLAVTAACTKMDVMKCKPVELGLPRQWREGLQKILNGMGNPRDGEEVHEHCYFGLSIVEAGRPIVYSEPDSGRFVLLDLPCKTASAPRLEPQDVRA